MVLLTLLKRLQYFAAVSRDQMMGVFPGHSCLMLSVGGAGHRLSLKGSQILSRAAEHSTALTHWCRAAWLNANGTCLHPTFSLLVTKEMLHPQNAEFPRPALSIFVFLKGNCCKVLIDRICEYSFLLIHKPFILWVLRAYCSLGRVNINFLEDWSSPGMAHTPLSLSAAVSITSSISIVDFFSWSQFINPSSVWHTQNVIWRWESIILYALTFRKVSYSGCWKDSIS